MLLLKLVSQFNITKFLLNNLWAQSRSGGVHQHTPKRVCDALCWNLFQMIILWNPNLYHSCF